MKKTRYIIPFKYNGDIRRLFNLETVKKHVKKNLPQIDLFVIEQGTVQVDKSSFFIFNDKKFNKSWALNFAVKKAIEDGFEKIVLGDADFICGKAEIEYAVELLDDHECISPFYKSVSYLEESESNDFILSHDIEKLKQLPEKRDPRAPTIPLAAGIVCFTTSAYIKIGGYPEDFEGWGGEDDVVSIRSTKCLKYAAILKGRAYHLYHDDPSIGADPSRFDKFDKHDALDKNEILANAKKDWESLGKIDLYKHKEEG